MYCTNCGKKIPDNAAVCDGCGWSSRPASGFQRPADLNDAPVYQQPTQPVYQQPAQPVYQQPAAPVAAPLKPEKKENIPLGVLGAIGGAILGGISIILFSQMNMISAISGVLLAICTMKGYELLGGKLSTVGIVVSIVLMAVTPFLADRLDWAIVLMQDTGMELMEALEAVPEMMNGGYDYGDYTYTIDQDDYISNLGMLYLFTALGAVSNVVNAIKARKK